MKNIKLILITLLFLGGTMWYTTAMNYTSDNGILTGRPNDYVTRAELAQVVYNIESNDTIIRQKSNIVTIETEKNIGSGIIIKEGYIVTTTHNLTGDFDIYLNGKPTPINGIIVKTEGDLTLIKADVDSSIWLGKPPKELDTVFLIGSPLGIRNCIIEGSYLTSNLVNADVKPGHSGGGLFDRQGKLIGMMQYKFTDEEGLGGFISIEQILDFID